MATTSKDVQDASASDEHVIREPATLDPAAKKLLDQPMTPNQPPPIKSDREAGRAESLAQARAVDDAVREVNRNVLPKLGGNTWANERERAEADAKAMKGKG